MKKKIGIFIATVILVFALLGCKITGGFGSAGNPSKVLLTDAKALFLQSGGAKSLKVIAGPDTLLMKVLSDSTVGPAIFIDSEGIELSVYINKALLLNADYLLINYTYESAITNAVIEMSTGYITSLSNAPDNWDRIREKDNRAYYIASGALCRLNLSSMALIKMNDAASDSLSSSSFIFINGSNNVFTLYMANTQNKKFRLYYDDGSTPKDFSSQPEAERFYDAVAQNVLSSALFAVEDEATRDVYYLRLKSTEISSQKITFSDTGTITAGPMVELMSTVSPGLYARLGTGKAYFANSIFTNDDNILKFSHSGGTISTINYTQSSELNSYANLMEGKYRNGSIFIGYEYITNGKYKIVELDVSGVSSSEALLIEEPGITAFEPVGDQVFYVVPAGVYKYDILSGITTLYSTVPADIQSVTE